MRVEQVPEAIQSAVRVLGWRVSATNHVAPSLGLAQAVEASRDEYLVERHFSRLKGTPFHWNLCTCNAMITVSAWCVS